MRRVAIVGAGIAGLGAALRLSAHPDRVRATLFEAEPRLGGHAHTVDVTLDGVSHGVDTGFLVFNQRTYPQLTRLFDALGVPTAASEMSFSVQLPDEGLEWSGRSLAGVFAQRRNLLRPGFLGMLAEIVRFNRQARAVAHDAPTTLTLGEFLDRHRYGPDFRRGYLLPMLGCIWSCPARQMLDFPLATLLRFCENHALLQFAGRPQWYTVAGGSRRYVRAIAARLADVRTSTPVRALRRSPQGPVTLVTDHGREAFDDVILACHADQALALLTDADPNERARLGAIPSHANVAVLHTDASLLPSRREAWAAWNYERAADAGTEAAAVCLHYLINRLQPLPWPAPVIVSLNPARPPAPERVLGRWTWRHPVFDVGAIAAQQQLVSIQGKRRTWFAGAWTRYGFHEDGLVSAGKAVDALLADWTRRDAAPALVARDAA